MGQPAIWKRYPDDSKVSNLGHGKNGCELANSKDGRNGEVKGTIQGSTEHMCTGI